MIYRAYPSIRPVIRSTSSESTRSFDQQHRPLHPLSHIQGFGKLSRLLQALPFEKDHDLIWKELCPPSDNFPDVVYRLFFSLFNIRDAVVFICNGHANTPAFPIPHYTNATKILSIDAKNFCRTIRTPEGCYVCRRRNTPPTLLSEPQRGDMWDARHERSP